MSKITNLALLNAAADLLQLQTGGEFPVELNTDDVKVVLNLRDASRAIPKLRILNLNASLAGLSELFSVMYQPPQGGYARILSASLVVEFNPAVASGSIMIVTHNIAEAVPNGTNNLIPVGGYGLYSPMNTVTNMTKYEVPLGACVVGGSASAPWASAMGLLIGQNFPPSSLPLALISEVRYYTGARVPQNFPALTNLNTKIAVLEYPAGSLLEVI